MKHKSFIYLLFLTTLFACSNYEDGINRIKELEIELYSKSKAAFNQETANQLIKEYLAFVDANASDSLAPGYLFSAAQVAMGMNMSKQAIDIYERVYEEYPDYEKAPTCLFLEAFVYETQENNNVEAQRIYSEFINSYPNHDLIDDARFSLENLDKSDEEIIREFEQKIANSKDSI